MEISFTVVLKRDQLDEDFRVCNQKILCPVPITNQILTFIEKMVNTNVKSKEFFIIKAPCSLDVYTFYVKPYAEFKKEVSMHYLLTYDGDIIDIEPKTQIF